MNNKWLTEEEFKSIYSQVPRLCVEVVINSPEGVLLTLRTLPTYNNMWHTPGGTVMVGEKLEEAVKRIALAELGVSATVEKILGAIEHIDEGEGRGFGSAVSIAHLCHLDSLNIKLNEEASEFKFFTSRPENMIKEQGDFLQKEGLLK